MNKFLKSQNGISLIVIIIIAVAVIGIIIYAVNYKDGHKLTIEEKNAYLNLRSQVTDVMNALEYNSRDTENYTGTLSKKDFELLKQMVKSEDSNNPWFTDSNTKEWVFATYNSEEALIKMGYSAEKAKEYEITYVYDGNYMATFWVRRIGTDYYFFDYEFVANNENKGVFLTIK